jgi:uncharacterized protein YuzE
MKITHDKIADAVYVYLKKGEISRTVKLSGSILVDVNKKGEAIGVEILNASGYIASKKSVQMKEKAPVLA